MNVNFNSLFYFTVLFALQGASYQVRLQNKTEENYYI